jgi:hypothetical protein
MNKRSGLAAITAGLLLICLPDGVEAQTPQTFVVSPLGAQSANASAGGAARDAKLKHLLPSNLASTAVSSVVPQALEGGSGSTRIISFDVPASCTPTCNGTSPAAINDSGTITGSYLDASGIYHGFVRSIDGAFGAFDAPTGCTSPCNGTYPTSINIFGVVAGFYADASGVYHGFLRTDDWPFERQQDCPVITFDPPGSVGTFVTAINLEGTIAGYHTDANNVYHSFLRKSTGNFTTFDPPSGYGTFATAINTEGAVAGNSWYTPSGISQYIGGFLRTPNGAFTWFDVPYPPCQECVWTFPTGINDQGTIVGYDYDQLNTYHGVLRTYDGTFTTFDAPGAGQTAYSVLGTFPQAINWAAAVTGYYSDANRVEHGFLRTS